MSAVDPFGLLYAISFPSGDHDAPIVVSDADVSARRTIPLPSGLTRTRLLFSSLKTMRRLILPGNALRPACEPIAVDPTTAESTTAEPSAVARRFIVPPSGTLPRSQRRLPGRSQTT